MIKFSYLHSSGVPGRVGAHLEESSLCRGRLTSVSGRPSLVHHHGLSSEQTHQMGRLFPLNHPHLVKTNCKVRTWKNDKTIVTVLMSFTKQTRAHWRVNYPKAVGNQITPDRSSPLLCRVKSASSASVKWLLRSWVRTQDGSMVLSQVLFHRLVGVKVCAMRSDDISCVWKLFYVSLRSAALSQIFMAVSKSSVSWVYMTGGREDGESLDFYVVVQGRTLPNNRHTCDCASSATIRETVCLPASCLVSHGWSSVFKLWYLILHRQWNILFLVSISCVYSPPEQTNQRPSQSLASASKPKTRRRQSEQRV